MSPRSSKCQKLINLLLTAALTICITELDNFHKCANAYRYRNSFYALPAFDSRAETTNDFWLEKGKEFVHNKTNLKFNTNRAKNIILMVGAGMGLTTITAARELLGGLEKQLAFEKFPHTGFTMTYTVNSMVTEAGAASTAYLCGVKSKLATIGVNGHVKRGDCDAMKNTSNYVDSIAKWALDEGKSAGLVTTRSVTQASPAGVYAHTAERSWENDADLAEVCGYGTDLKDIALQLITGTVGRQLSVILGGGKGEFLDCKFDAEGERRDKRDLIKEFLRKSRGNAFVETREELLNFNVSSSKRLLGLFDMKRLSYHKRNISAQPTLKEMTTRAIEMLQKNDKGFFLFINNGRINIAHLKNKLEYALIETVEFSNAVQAVRDMTSEEDTLIVVTADHSHTLTISGYQPRKYSLLDVAPRETYDEKYYLPVSYASGPGFKDYFDRRRNERRDPREVRGNAKTFPSGVYTNCGTHSAEDVAVYASGPWAHLFTGVYEQNDIPHIMAYATCVGKGAKSCK